jgi:ABC-type nitrate/sulfonate/bicarbonate transport system ATPase subunit/ABC-type nitrate/sulfonate/bicarbonate transport system permease component
MSRVFVLLGIITLLVLWAGVSYLVGSYIVPPPWLTLLDTLTMLGQGHTWIQTLITLFRVLAGFLLAFAIGTVLGICCGKKRNVEGFFRPMVLLLQGIPPLLWAIPLILILGIGHLSPVLVIALICLPLVTVNVIEGTKSAPLQLEEMLRVFAPGFYPKMRELLFPHLRPFLSSSLRLGIILSIKASVVAEYFCSGSGIGFQIQAAYQSLQVRRLFSWALLLVVLVILSQYLLTGLIREGAKKKTVSQRRRARTGVSGKSPATVPLLGVGSQQFRFEHVSFAYPSGLRVLYGIDLTVYPGEIVVISGESGIGKTTLLHVAASLLRPTSGRVIRPERLSLAFQDDRLLAWRTVGWNVALPFVYSGFAVDRALSYAVKLLKKMGLEGVENEFPDELSGGMKKRVCLARCFARAPEAVLLDEPFSGIHREARQQLWIELYDLLSSSRIPVIVATHFPEEIPFRPDCRFYSLMRVGDGTARLVSESPRFIPVETG